MTERHVATFERTSAVRSGDYFQVLFESGDGDDRQDPLMQRSFEPPGTEVCYVETSDLVDVGHFRASSAKLSRDHLLVEWHGRPPVEVSFNASDSEHDRLRRILRIMIPELEVVDAC